MQNFPLNRLTLAIALSTFASTSWAEIEAANGNTQVLKKSGIEIVNIATPNQNGLSHNQYQKYNVGNKGAVLNNALATSQSQLAGTVSANPKLNQRAANVILNEVVSRNPSVLSGKQEIVGQRADYVLANPNGISCNGCGFINTQRASLVVGKPTIEQERLTGYQVKGEKSLTAQGDMQNSDLDHLDLIAPKVEISGDVRGAKNINVVMGRNQVKRDNAGQAVVTQAVAEGQVLDGKVAGSMHAGRIRIHSADNRATLTVESADIQAKDTAITAGNLAVQGKVTKTQDYSKSDTKEGKNIRVYREIDQSQEQFHKTSIKSDNLVLSAQNTLTVTGADLQAKQATLSGGKTHFGTQTTTRVYNTVKNQSKGSWQRNESDQTNEQTLHRTTISADDVKIIASKDKVTGQAVRLTANNAGVYGEKGVELKGATTTNQYAATSDFKRETAKLKTGKSTQRSTEQNYTASELNVKNQGLIASNADVHLSGTKVAADDVLLVKADKVRIGSETTKHSYQLDDKERFWGGLAGSKTVGAAVNETRQHGSDITVARNLRIETDNGATILGSRVIAKGDGYVVAKNGNLEIDSVTSQLNKEASHRIGTVFNILKAREHSFSQVETAKGSTLKSESNLYLSTNKNVNVRGSEVIADQLLDIAAVSGVSVTGATNLATLQREQASTSLTGKVDTFKINFDKEGALKEIIQGAIEGKPASNVLDVIKGKISGTAQGTAKIGYQHQTENSQNVTHTAATVAGENTQIQTGTLNVAGSTVAATAGNLNVVANNITTQAQQNQYQSLNKTTDVGLTLTGKATQNGLTGTVSLGVNHNQNNTTSTTAQGSQLVAQGDLTLNANRIQHQGSHLSAGQNIVQNAAEISQTAAANTVQSHGKNVNVGLTLEAGIDKSKVINGSVTLQAEGGRELAQSSTAQATQLNAGGNISLKTDRLQDQGTQYQAGQNVNLTSKQHDLLAAQNSAQKQSLTAGASVAVSGSTSDLQSVNLKVAVGGKFQMNNSSERQDQLAAIHATNVNLETGRLTSQANIHADQNATITASQGAHFSQANHEKSQQGGGFTANVGVGALVIPATGAAIPSIDVSVSANGQRGESNQGSAATISANQLTVNSPNIDLQGTNVNATNATFNAEQFNASAVNSHNQNLNVSVAAGTSIGAGVSNVGINGKIGVQHENSTQHSATTLAANTLNVKAQNANFTGVTSQGQQLNLNAENVTLSAGQNSVNKTQFDAGISLNGGVANNQWTPSGGSANLAVDVVRNQPHTASQLNSQNAQVNAQNVALVGSQINANQVAGNVNTLTNLSKVDKINEVSVNLSANGSGKVTPYPNDKWLDAARKDWESGTIAGVSADAKFGLNLKRQQQNVVAGVNSQNGWQAKNQISSALVKPYDRKLGIEAHLNTNAKEMLKRAKEDVKNKRFPWVKVQR